MKTVACVIVDTPKVFQFLGHLPLLGWAVEKLSEVRGIDKIICLAQHNLASDAKKFLAEYEIECLTIPKEFKVGTAGYNSYIGSVMLAYDVAVRLKPTTPFLPASKIEKCVSLVSKNKAAKAWPARRIGRGCEEAMGLTVVHTRKNDPGAVKSVPVSLIESLDADRQDEYVLISALVESGKV